MGFSLNIYQYDELHNALELCIDESIECELASVLSRCYVP